MENENKDFEVIHIEDTDKRFVARQSVYMMIDGEPVDTTMYKHNTPFVISGNMGSYRDKHNDDMTINFQDIQKIHLDLKSSYQNFGIFSQFVFYPYVNMECNEGTYKFLAKNKDDFAIILKYFHSLNIPIEDPRAIQEAFKKYPRDYERCKFFQRTHKDLTKYGAYDQPDLFKAAKDSKKKK